MTEIDDETDNGKYLEIENPTKTDIKMAEIDDETDNGKYFKF